MHHFALTLIGRDRPGIVARLTQILYQRGANLADSSCTILGGQFAMILIVSHPTVATVAGFGDAFSALADDDLAVVLRALPPGGEQATRLRGELCLVSVYGADQPGIVYRVTQELAARRINVTDMNTKLVGTAESPVYVMMLEGVLPEDVTIDFVAQELQQLGRDLHVDLSVRSITPVEL
ncbi:MAG: glycine cleavage system protein R [Myxococcota bacterium]